MPPHKPHKRKPPPGQRDRPIPKRPVGPVGRVRPERPERPKRRRPPITGPDRPQGRKPTSRGTPIRAVPPIQKRNRPGRKLPNRPIKLKRRNTR